MDSIVPVAVVSVVVGSLIALAVFGNYFRKRKSEVESIAQPEAIQKASKPPQSTSKKSRSKPHSHAADKDGHPPLGWSDTLAYLVLPVLLVLSQYISVQIMQSSQNFCAGESSKQNVPCECAKAPVEPLESMTALWKPLNCLVETAGITKPGKSIVQESVANSALPIVHEDEKNANKITKLKERANKSKVNNDEGRPIPMPSGSEKPKKNRRGRPKRAMATEGTNITPQAVVNAASTMCYRKVHPIWLSLIPSDAHDFREGDAPLPQLRSCYLMINAVFGEEMWPAAEYGRTMYTIRQRVGPLLMKMQKRYGKMDETGELTEKEIIRAERNSGVISNRVREIQMQNYLRKKEMKEQRENDLRQGLQLYKNAKYEEALEKFESVLGTKPDPNEASVASYNVACCYSKLNQIQAGLSALKDALEAGFEDFKRIRTDPDLANIRKSEEFELLMKRFDESFINENAINAIKSLFGIFDKK